MKRICALVVCLFVLSSCKMDALIDGLSKAADVLSGTGTNVFVSTSSLQGAVSETVEEKVNSITASFENPEKKATFDRARGDIDNAIRDFQEGIANNDAASFSEIKDVIKDLFESISLDKEEQDSFLLEISKAGTNEATRKSINDKIAQSTISADSAAGEAYKYVMDSMGDLLKIMNNGEEEAFEYYLRFGEDSDSFIDFSPVFDNPSSEPTIADVVVMSMMSNMISDLLDFEDIQNVSLTEVSGLITDVVDLCVVCEMLSTTNENGEKEYKGFVGTINKVMDKLLTKGVINM